MRDLVGEGPDARFPSREIRKIFTSHERRYYVLINYRSPSPEDLARERRKPESRCSP